MTKQELKDNISTLVKANGSNAITGDGLQEKLLLMIDELHGLIFPNGIEMVSESRFYVIEDAGKLLIIDGDGVGLYMPEINPFNIGDNVGITSISIGANFNFIFDTDSCELLQGDYLSEVVLLTNVNVETEVKMFPISTTIKDKRTTSKYLYDQSQNMNSYSTDEKRTEGTWIDGKPIYRTAIQVIELSELINIINYSSFDIENFVKINFIANTNYAFYNANIESYKTSIVTNASSTEITYNLQSWESNEVKFGVFVNKFDETIDFYNTATTQGMDIIEAVDVPRPYNSTGLYISNLNDITIIIEYTKTTD